VQVRQEAAALLVVGVRDAVNNALLLSGDLANAGHTNNLENSVTWEQGDQAPSSGPNFIPALPRDLKAGGPFHGGARSRAARGRRLTYFT
jgi:hypothetical protein